jgi:hypothetical protein
LPLPHRTIRLAFLCSGRRGSGFGDVEAQAAAALAAAGRGAPTLPCHHAAVAPPGEHLVADESAALPRQPVIGDHQAGTEEGPEWDRVRIGRVGHELQDQLGDVAGRLRAGTSGNQYGGTVVPSR